MKATADSAIFVLVVPVATTAPHCSKLIRCSLLGCRQAPDGYLRVRGQGAQLKHATSFDPKELAVFVCDFALACGGARSDLGLAPACACAFEPRKQPLLRGQEDAADRHKLCDLLLAERSAAVTGSGWLN